ncbi:MAG: hypothetical protein ACRD1A_07925 [Terriglobales bacterium]
MPVRLHFPERKSRLRPAPGAVRARLSKPNWASAATFAASAVPVFGKLRKNPYHHWLAAFTAGVLVVLLLYLRALSAPQEFYPDPDSPEGASPAPHSWRAANLASELGTVGCIVILALLF